MKIARLIERLQEAQATCKRDVTCVVRGRDGCWYEIEEVEIDALTPSSHGEGEGALSRTLLGPPYILVG
jgi:hypothetical protein